MSDSREKAIVRELCKVLKEAIGSRVVTRRIPMDRLKPRGAMLWLNTLTRVAAGGGQQRFTLKITLLVCAVLGSDEATKDAVGPVADVVRDVMNAIHAEDLLTGDDDLDIEGIVRGPAEYIPGPVGEAGGMGGAFIDLDVSWVE